MDSGEGMHSGGGGGMSSPYGFEDEGRVDDEHDAQGLGVVVLRAERGGGGTSGKGHVSNNEHMTLKDSGTRHLKE